MDTPVVLALLDDLAFASVGDTLRLKYNVRTFLAKPVTEDAALCKRPIWATDKRIQNRKVIIPRKVHALYKFQIWTLVEYDSIVWFDNDVLFPVIVFQ